MNQRVRGWARRAFPIVAGLGIVFLVSIPRLLASSATLPLGSGQGQAAKEVTATEVTGSSAVGTAAAMDERPEIESIVKKIDDLYRSQSSYSEATMEIETPHWQRTLEMLVWTEGMEKTFIRLLEPKKERGVGTLRIGSEMWNFLPKTNKVIKIPPSMMMSSWMGSDFTNDDLVKEFTLFEDYTFSWTEVEDPDESLLYIESVPREDLPVVWGHIVVGVRKSDHMPVWQRFYDEKGRLMRTLFYKDIRTFGKRTIPATMEMIPVNKEGHRTLIRFEKLEFDRAVDEDVFTLRNLRSPL